MLNFSFPPVADRSTPYPKYFRADYRMDIDLDNIDETAVRSGSFMANDISNKGCIFRDAESPKIGSTIASGFSNCFFGPLCLFGGIPKGEINDIFDALEKPLAFEIVSYGLVGGNPPPGITRQHTWDNVHVWPAKRGGSEKSTRISTPGAFHSFHLHWRWGAVSGNPSERGQLLPKAGDPQFTGVGWSKTEGEP